MFEENKNLLPKSLVIAIIFALGVFADRVFIKFTNQTIKPSQSASLSEIVNLNNDEENEKDNKDERLFLVKRVLDGDTILLENGEKVRYIGIDSPESVDPAKPIECFSDESASKNKELVEGKKVSLVKDVREKDKYDRLLRYVYLGKTFVNLELVRSGFASATTFPPDVKYQKVFLEAEREARLGKKGLWSKCKTF